MVVDEAPERSEASIVRAPTDAAASCINISNFPLQIPSPHPFQRRSKFGANLAHLAL